MKNRVLQTTGDGVFSETDYELPFIGATDIRVSAVMTGVCRSDIDMMQGNFGPLPLNMQGHEGLGIVVEVGSEVVDVSTGDFVATRGEPAYADYYNVRKDEYVKVPEADPKYIIEPVACGVNLVMQAEREIGQREGFGKRCLILGSGFLAWVAYTVLKNYNFEYTVVGNSNKDIWGDILTPDYEGDFDVVIDLSSRDDVFTKPIMRNEGLVIFGAQKTVTTDFANLLWKACTIVFPSPRTAKFIDCMRTGVDLIEKGNLVVDKFWSKGYNRTNEWQQAFEDGVNRPAGYSRGYIYWD
jgi:D-arabinose 1-dehydrogenase-like Zn-dependent alcohol dehydrogenase